MSKEMDSIKNLKVADVFDLTKVSFPVSYTDDQVRVAGRAIANYDRMADEIAELREMLKKHKEFNENMHEMPPEWTVKRSIELHKKTIELLYSNK